jgi:hypothetical protein
MSKLLRLIFLIMATCILVDDYICLTYIEDKEVAYSDIKDHANDNEDEKDSNQDEKDGNQDGSEEKNNKENAKEIHRFFNYDVYLKSTYFSIQHSVFAKALLYETRCLELESPPPEA